jgi:hypothetical protein
MSVGAPLGVVVAHPGPVMETPSLRRSPRLLQQSGSLSVTVTTPTSVAVEVVEDASPQRAPQSPPDSMRRSLSVGGAVVSPVSPWRRSSPRVRALSVSASLSPSKRKNSSVASSTPYNVLAVERYDELATKVALGKWSLSIQGATRHIGSKRKRGGSVEESSSTLSQEDRDILIRAVKDDGLRICQRCAEPVLLMRLRAFAAGSVVEDDGSLASMSVSDYIRARSPPLGLAGELQEREYARLLRAILFGDALIAGITSVRLSVARHRVTLNQRRTAPLSSLFSPFDGPRTMRFFAAQLKAAANGAPTNVDPTRASCSPSKRASQDVGSISQASRGLDTATTGTGGQRVVQTALGASVWPDALWNKALLARSTGTRDVTSWRQTLWSAGEVIRCCALSVPEGPNSQTFYAG